MKKRIIIITSIIAIIIMIVSLSVMRYQRELKRQEEMQIETQVELMRIQNERYIRQLCIDGEFSYEPNGVIVNEMQINYMNLIQHIALYNEFNNEKKVTVEQVLEEYENFCNGEGGTEALDAVLHFDFGNHNLTLEHSYSTYTAYYTNYLMDECGLDNPTKATHKQLQEAAEYAAERIHEEIENE